jgi:hypothetical protein
LRHDIGNFGKRQKYLAHLVNQFGALRKIYGGWHDGVRPDVPLFQFRQKFSAQPWEQRQAPGHNQCDHRQCESRPLQNPHEEIVVKMGECFPYKVLSLLHPFAEEQGTQRRRERHG